MIFFVAFNWLQKLSHTGTNASQRCAREDAGARRPRPIALGLCSLLVFVYFLHQDTSCIPSALLDSFQ